MQDVFQKIYQKKHLQIEKRRRDRQLNLPQPKQRNRLYKGIWQDYRPLIQTFKLQQQLTKKKQLLYGNDFLKERQRYKVHSVASTSQSLKLPSIHRLRENNSQKNSSRQRSQYQVSNDVIFKNPRRLKMREEQQHKRLTSKRLRKIFRLRTYQIIFIVSLNQMRRISLLNKRKLTQQYSQDLLQIIQKMVNQYYVVILQEQLLKYLQLIKIKIQQPKIMLEKQIINMVYFMSKQLAKSSVIRELMEFIILISDEGSFFPSDYLTLFQIQRLQFNSKYGCSKNVTSQHAQMLIAVLVGLKIFCAFILYRPWKLNMAKTPINSQYILQNFHKVHKLIHGTGSIFYFMIMDLFCLTVPKNPNSRPNIWKKFKIQPKTFINIFSPNFQVEIDIKQHEIFPYQNRKLFETLQKENSQTFSEIKENINIWFSRIYTAFIKQKLKKLAIKRNQIKQQQIKIMKSLLKSVSTDQQQQGEITIKKS